MSNTGSQYPKTVSFSQTIPFDQPLSYMAQYTISGALTFTTDTTGAYPGYGTMIRLVADGSHTPNFSAFASEGSGTWDNTNGAVNKVFFYYDGSQYCVIITQPGAGGTGGGDTTPPTINGMIATDATTISVTFNESVNTAALTGWSFKKNGSSLAASAVSAVTGTVWDFTVATMANGDTITASYDSGTGNVQNLAGLDLASFTDSAVTNSIPGYDADAEAFFTATGISDTGQKDAVDALVTAFKTASVWTKMHAIYPCVGGTGTTHKYNLKDPRDLDAAYRLSYLSTTPHNANGIAFDGEGYCDTFFNTNGRSDLALGYYSHDNIDGLLVDMGSYDGTNVCDIKASIGGNATSTILSGGITWANANAVGLVVGSRLSSSDHKLYWNGIEKASESSQTGTFPNMTIYLGGRHVTGSVTLRTTRTCSFAFISDGLTGTEVTAVSTAIANFQTALGR